MISRRRKVIDNPYFNGLSVRQQKIVRRMAHGCELIFSQFTKKWALVQRHDAPYTRCNVRAKDAVYINFLCEIQAIRFHAMMADIRRETAVAR